VLEVAKKGMRVGFGKKGVRHAVCDGRTSLLNLAFEVPSSSVKSYDGLVGIIFIFGPLQVALFDKVFMIVHEVPEILFPAVVASESNWLVWLMFVDAHASVPCSIRRVFPETLFVPAVTVSRVVMMFIASLLRFGCATRMLTSSHQLLVMSLHVSHPIMITAPSEPF